MALGRWPKVIERGLRPMPRAEATRRRGRGPRHAQRRRFRPARPRAGSIAGGAAEATFASVESRMFRESQKCRDEGGACAAARACAARRRAELRAARAGGGVESGWASHARLHSALLRRAPNLLAVCGAQRGARERAPVARAPAARGDRHAPVRAASVEHKLAATKLWLRHRHALPVALQPRLHLDARAL